MLKAKPISRFFQVYFMPAAVFQSVIVGGGYGTGREVVEYFTRYGAYSGLLGILLTFVCWSIVISLTFELARISKSYDYRLFLQSLVGKGWVIFEILFITILMIALAILLSAAGTLLFDSLAIPQILTMAIIIGLVAWAIRYGTAFIEKILSVWAGLISIFFLVVMIAVFSNFSNEISLTFKNSALTDGWLKGAFTFTLYMLCVVPVLLYSVMGIQTRREAILSGIITASLGVLPALLMHLTLLGKYPQVLDEPIPLHNIISLLDSPILLVTYFILLLGTIIQTAIGLLQGVAERIEGWMEERRKSKLNPSGRSLLSVGALVGSAALSYVGIINLIAAGYGTLAWGFMAIYVLPTLTIGVWKIITHKDAKP